jgi:23S rRNA maturation-related 3'-5' exoribonuclease YhaM
MIAENALKILRENSTFGQSLENHCLRICEFAVLLANYQGNSINQDLLLAGCYLHDIGLCISKGGESNYLKRGFKFINPYFNEWNLNQKQQKEFHDMMLYNHSLRKIRGISYLGEIVRKSVQIEHSFGIVKYNLDTEKIKKNFYNYPRLDFNKVLLQFFVRAFRDGGPIEIFRLFFPR